MDSFLTAYSALGLMITLKKTSVIYQPASDKAYSVLNSVLICMDKNYGLWKSLYLGSTVNMTNTCDDEISLWSKKPSYAFVKLD